MTIPNFPYPSNIFNYLMSQTKGYVIHYSQPSGGKAAFTSNLPPPEPTPPWTPSETTAAVTTPAPTTTQPAPTTIPAFNTTSAPTAAKQGGNPWNKNTNWNRWNEWNRRNGIRGNKYYGAPPIWIAAIQAMEFVRDTGPLTQSSQLDAVYTNLIAKINNFKQGDNNSGALIYFCTVVTVLFAPFINQLKYNFLHGQYSQLFPNAKVYQKFCMVYLMSSNLCKFFDKNKYGYIPSNDRAMKYTLPMILNSITDLLDSTNPLEKQ
jgi:hypothetical protein